MRAPARSWADESKPRSRPSAKAEARPAAKGKAKAKAPAKRRRKDDSEEEESSEVRLAMVFHDTDLLGCRLAYMLLNSKGQARVEETPLRRSGFRALDTRIPVFDSCLA